MVKGFFSLFLSIIFVVSSCLCAYGDEELPVEAKAAVLMEAKTGKIFYEKNANEKLSPASITKIMTLILIFDNIDNGKIKLSDEVATSAYAKSMGGSQVFLEEGETQSVETLIKCIVVASGNDASVTMAEYIAGSEGAFVDMMNERAKSLLMTNTHFEDCTGLTDSDNHYTTAMDVAKMSRELITRYPDIHKYSTIWMENITHVTKKGSSEFGLSNTNKLLKQYAYTTGLKTGSTSKAKYCVSATAKKENVDMIAVIMAAPDYKSRFSEAITLLDYGFRTCRIYEDKNNLEEEIKVKGGIGKNVRVNCYEKFYYAGKEEDIANIKKDIVYDKEKIAPVKKGSVVGAITYSIGTEKIGSVNIVAAEDVEEMSFIGSLTKIFKLYFGVK